MIQHSLFTRFQKQIFLSIAIFSLGMFFSNVFAQVLVYNNGGSIFAASGSLIHIDGTTENANSGKINNQGGAILITNGNLWNDASDTHNGKDWSPYKYRMKLLFWPWRARMAPGWRMMIVPNLWEWHTEWHAFSGAPKANYHVNFEKTGLGSHSKWDIPLDTNYNYYNLETVLAVHREHVIPAGTVTFWAIPIYEP